MAPARHLRPLARLLLAMPLCLALSALGQQDSPSIALQAVTLERELIAAELNQIEKTIALLQGSTRANANSESTAVRQLNAEAKALKERLIQLSEQEIALLKAEVTQVEAAAIAEPPPAIESKPLRNQTPDYSEAAEAARVAKLYSLLRNFKAEEEQSRQIEPTDEELAEREAASADAQRLARIPFSASKVRLSGAEGSAALAQISERLANPDIPESRRDSAPLCSIRTHLFGTMIASERRSMTPVGKHHYVTRVELQPGDTTVRIPGHSWQVNLPEDINTRPYLITLYKPPGVTPQFHIFAVEEWLAEEQAHIPAWLPEPLGLARSG